MGDKVFLRQKWTRYLGELRPIHDIDVFFVPSTPSPTPSLTPTITPSCPLTTQYMNSVVEGGDKIRLSLWNDAGYTSSTTAKCDYVVSGTMTGSSGTTYNGERTFPSGDHQIQLNFTSILQPGETIIYHSILGVNTSACTCPTTVNFTYVPPTPSPTNTPTLTPTPFLSPSVTPSLTPSLTPTNTLTPTITQTSNIGYAGTYYSASTYCDACNKINGNFVTLYTTGTCINDSVVEFVYLDANLTQPAGPGGISWTGTCSAPSSLFGGTLLSSGELDILYLCSTCPGVTPSVTPTNTLTPTISPTITNSPTPSITQTLTPSLTQTLTPTITSTMTPTPSSGITGCLCYSLLNETGSPINYQYDDCVSGATSGSLNGGQSIQVCAVDLPTIDPGGTITPCSSVTNCSQSSDCTGCS